MKERFQTNIIEYKREKIKKDISTEKYLKFKKGTSLKYWNEKNRE